MPSKGGPDLDRAMGGRSAMNAFSRSKMWRYKWLAFTLTFFSYVSFHCTRKVFSVIKSNLSDEDWFGPHASAELGLLDALFLFCYAFGLLVFGSAGDRYNVVKVLVAGMWLSALVCFLFGLGGYLNVHSLPYYAALWGLNGAVQSVGWPANVTVMGNWFRRKERGAVIGIWSGNACLGNIVGTGVVTLVIFFVGTVQGWKLAMIVAAGVVFVEGLLCIFFLVPHPEKIGLPDVNLLDRLDMVRNAEAVAKATSASGRATLTTPAIDTKAVAEDDKTALSVWKALLIPGVIPYSICYACLKAVNYALFFWLPLYLHDAFYITDTRSDLISILGGWAGGYVSDRLGVRSPVAVVMMLAASACLWFFNNASLTLIQILLPLTGFLMGGPANLISGTVAADLGSNPQLAGNKKALSTVTAIIDGTGSVGAAFVQYLVGWLVSHTVHCVTRPDGDKHCTHWDAIFYMLVIGDVLAALCLSWLCFRDLQLVCHRWRKKRRKSYTRLGQTAGEPEDALLADPAAAAAYDRDGSEYDEAGTAAAADTGFGGAA